MVASALAKYNSATLGIGSAFHQTEIAIPNEEWRLFLRGTSCPLWFSGSRGLVRISHPRDNIEARGRRLCRIGSIGSTVIRITAKNGRRKNPERSRRETKPSVHVGFKCLAHVQFPDVRSVERSCNQPANRCRNVPSAASHFILASSVRTSIPRAYSSARNPYLRGFRARMKSMSVRSIPCG